MPDSITVAFEMGDGRDCISLAMRFDGVTTTARFCPKYARDLAERLTIAAEVFDETRPDSDESEDDEPPADASGESVLPPGPDPQPPGR